MCTSGCALGDFAWRAQPLCGTAWKYTHVEDLLIHVVQFWKSWPSSSGCVISASWYTGPSLVRAYWFKDNADKSALTTALERCCSTWFLYLVFHHQLFLFPFTFPFPFLAPLSMWSGCLFPVNSSPLSRADPVMLQKSVVMWQYKVAQRKLQGISGRERTDEATDECGKRLSSVLMTQLQAKDDTLVNDCMFNVVSF